MQPSVLIIILNYCTYDLTISLIKEIKSCLKYDNYSIMVVDNCSPNESAQVLERNSVDLGFVFFANKTNSGYAAGNNIGIRYAINHNYDYSWIVNNDVLIIDKNVLTDMVNTANQDSEIAVVGPKIISSNNIPVAPFCNRTSLKSETIGLKREKEYRETQISISRFVYYVHGCCMLLKNTAMKEIDCLDERTFLYGEEAILAERLIAKCYKEYYLASVTVKHNEGSSIKLSPKRLKIRLKEDGRSREIYLKDYRHFPFPKRLICHIFRSLIIIVRNIR